MENERKCGLSGNILKIIACISMLIDHIGVFLFPGIPVLRIIGRLAFPIFSFMIYEGCRYTKNKLRYFSVILLLGAITSLVSSIANGSLYFTVLITFSCSILLIYLLQWLFAAEKDRERAGIAGLFLAAAILMYLLTKLVKVEFDFSGILLPLFPTLAHLLLKDTRTPLVQNFSFYAFAAGLMLHAVIRNDYQVYALFSLVLLALYNGERGMRLPKYSFYIFYPAHMILLYLISLLPFFAPV